MAYGFTIENGVLIKYGGKDRTVVITNGVTTIGDKTFYKNDYITSVEIPRVLQAYQMLLKEIKTLFPLQYPTA